MLQFLNDNLQLLPGLKSYISKSVPSVARVQIVPNLLLGKLAHSASSFVLQMIKNVEKTLLQFAVVDLWSLGSWLGLVKFLVYSSLRLSSVLIVGVLGSFLLLHLGGLLSLDSCRSGLNFLLLSSDQMLVTAEEIFAKIFISSVKGLKINEKRVDCIGDLHKLGES